MINIPMKSSSPLTKQNIFSLNQKSIQQPRSSRDVLSINLGKSPSNLSSPTNPISGTIGSSAFSQQQTIANTNLLSNSSIVIPHLLHTVQKGQKIVLSATKSLNGIKVCLGWNFNSVCDVDVSAFMLNQGNKVIGDNWFVFYGQTLSPDNSTVFHPDELKDRESISVDFKKLNSSVHKIVFVLSINDALIHNYNFSMIRDAYIRILDIDNNTELVSFKMDEYYSNVTSMMIGEIYLHNNIWKFNAVGNGVAKDLAGLCELYGVQVI